MTVAAPIPAIDDVLVRSLFGRLPPPGSTWPAEEQAAWLRAAVRVFGVVYPHVEPPTIEFDGKSGILKIAGKPLKLDSSAPDKAEAA